MHGWFAGAVRTFRVSFTDPSDKVDQLVASVLGPFPRRGKIVAALLLAAMALALFRARSVRTSSAPPSPAPPREGLLVPVAGARLAAAALFGLALLAPGAVQVPDDICLLDFRLLTTATIVGIVLVPPGLVSRARLAVLAGGVAAFLALWARQLDGAADEVMQTVRLVDRLEPQDRLLALSMHDSSAYLDESNAVLHYAGVYHTVRNGGVTSLFWAQLIPRLPVGYRSDHVPPAPPDWSPWQLTDEQLAHYTHVLVRWPGERRRRSLASARGPHRHAHQGPRPRAHRRRPPVRALQGRASSGEARDRYGQADKPLEHAPSPGCPPRARGSPPWAECAPIPSTIRPGRSRP